MRGQQRSDHTGRPRAPGAGSNEEITTEDVSDATEGRAIGVDMWIPPRDWESYDDELFDPPRVEIEDDESTSMK